MVRQSIVIDPSLFCCCTDYTTIDIYQMLHGRLKLKEKYPYAYSSPIGQKSNEVDG